MITLYIYEMVKRLKNIVIHELYLNSVATMLHPLNCLRRDYICIGSALLHAMMVSCFPPNHHFYGVSV